MFCACKKSKIIKSPAHCEVRSVIRFLSTRNMSAAAIHRQISEVYGANAMSDEKELGTSKMALTMSMTKPDLVVHL